MLRTSLAGVLLLWLPAITAAQAAVSGTVVGRGFAELRKQPEKMRMQLELRAQGKDLKEALAKLGGLRATARDRLLELGAPKGTIGIGPPTTVRHPVGLPLLPNALPGEPPTPVPEWSLPPKPPIGVIVAQMLQVDWSLPQADAEAALIFVNTLQEKIEPGALGGKSKDDKATSRLDAQPNDGKAVAAPCNCGCKSGEPSFLFVTRISTREQAAVMAEAFDKAKLEAILLAQAVGAEVAGLQQLTKDLQLAPDSLAPPWPVTIGGPVVPSSQPEEITGLVLETLKHRVALSATFGLQGPATNR